ncbi:hypothetical protein VPHD479_0018 [Vibrio phage D479]
MSSIDLPGKLIDATAVDPHTHPISDIIGLQAYLDRIINWRGEYANGIVYERNDLVRDGDWLMLALQETTDQPAPANSEPNSSIYDGRETFVESSFDGTVDSGYTITFDKDGYVRRLLVYVPEIKAGLTHRLIVENITDPNNISVSDTTNIEFIANNWASVEIGNSLIKAGTKFRVYLSSLSRTSETVFNGRWMFESSSDTVLPTVGSGGWTRFKHNQIRISKRDLDDQVLDPTFADIVPGTTLDFTRSSNVENGYTYLVRRVVDNTSVDYIDLDVTLSDNRGTLADGDITDTVINIPTGVDTKYVSEADFLSNYPPTFATVEGYLSLNGAVQPDTTNIGYGLEFDYQPAVLSSDWTMVVHAHGGAGGDGSVIDPDAFLPQLRGGEEPEAFAATLAYDIDSRVVYNSREYRAVASSLAGPWVEANWVEVSIQNNEERISNLENRTVEIEYEYTQSKTPSEYWSVDTAGLTLDEFNQPNVQIFFNGIKLRKGGQAIWISANELRIIYTSIETEDYLIVRKTQTASAGSITEVDITQDKNPSEVWTISGVNIGNSVSEFADPKIQVYYNGVKLRKGAQVVWISATELQLNHYTSVQSEDYLTIRTTV